MNKRHLEDPIDFDRPHPVPIEFLVGKFFIAVVFLATLFLQLLQAIRISLRHRRSDTESTPRRTFNRWVVVAAIWTTTSYALEAAVSASSTLRLDRMRFSPNVLVLAQEVFSKLSNVFVGLVVFLLVRLRTKVSTDESSTKPDPLPWRFICTAVPITCWVLMTEAALAGPSIVISLFVTPMVNFSLLKARKMTDMIEIAEHLYFGFYLVMTVALVTSGVRLWRSLKATASVSDYDAYDSNLLAIAIRTTSALLAVRAVFALRYHLIVYIPTISMSFGYVTEDITLFLVESLTYVVIFHVAVGQGQIGDGKVEDHCSRKVEVDDGKGKGEAKEEMSQKIDAIA